ncbi:MAG: hypothetical protein RMJ82_06235 [Gemmatales bacterium]|nr:hypothetical protein [Gemmatales bacterium]
MTTRQRCAQLWVEALEARSLPAGNVTATLIAGTLRIVGDSDDNDITVDVSGGNVVVTGNSGTTVNSAPSASFPAMQVKALDIRMNDGDDVVVVDGLNLTRTSSLRGGDGDDDFTIKNSSFRNATIRLDPGLGTYPEWLRIDNSTFSHPVSIFGSNQDTLMLVKDSVFGSNVTVRTFGGDDYYVIWDNSDVANGAATLNLGDGLNYLQMDGSTFNILNVRGGSDNDTVMLGSMSSVTVNLSATFLLGGGTNDLSINGGSWGILTIQGGSGVDYIDILNVSVTLGTTKVSTFGGNDDVDLLGSIFADAVTVLLGAGDDTLTLNSNTFNSGPGNLDLFDGGTGNDTYSPNGTITNLTSANSGLAAAEVVNFYP